MSPEACDHLSGYCAFINYLIAAMLAVKVALIFGNRPGRLIGAKTGEFRHQIGLQPFKNKRKQLLKI